MAITDLPAPVLAIFVLGCSSARAQPLEDLTLSWHAPAECPDEAAVRARIQSHLPPGEREAHALVATARITADGRRYRMELDLRGDETPAHRTVAGDSCAALADVAALLVALAIDPQSSANDDTPAQPAPVEADPDADATTAEGGSAHTPGQPQRAAAPAAPRTRATAPAASDPKASEPERVTADDAVPASAKDAAAPSAETGAGSDHGSGPALGVEVGAALRLAAGMLPQAPAIGLAPQLGLRVGRVHARAAFTFWLPSRSSADRYPSAALDAHGMVGDAAGCFELVRVPLALAPCATVELGRLVLETHDIAMPAKSSATWAAAGGGVRAGYSLTSGLQTALDAFVLAPFTRPRWLVQTSGGNVEVFVTARVALRVSAAVLYVFE